MKKLFALAIVMMMVIGGVFAAAGTSGQQTSAENLSATTDVLLKFGVDDNSSRFEIGFSTEPVDENNFSDFDKNGEVSLTINATGTAASNSEDPLFVYWNIIDKEGIKLELAIPGPLEDSAVDSPTTDTIDWQVAFTTEEGGSATSEEATAESPKTLLISNEALLGVGSKQLTVSTLGNALVGKDAATYTGELIVRVASN